MPSITKSEIDRIKSILTPTPSNKTNPEDSKRLHLKSLSDARVSKWTDTLASQRLARLEWKRHKEIADELVRLDIDKKEALLQESTRKSTIERATRSLYERKDKVINLRSRQLYTDVVAGRDDQIEEKRRKDREERDLERTWHEETVRNVARANRKEDDDAAAKKRKARDIAEMLFRQRIESDRRKELSSKKRHDDEVRFVLRIKNEEASEKKRVADEKDGRRQHERDLMSQLKSKTARDKETLLRKEAADAESRKMESERVERVSVARAALSKKHILEKQMSRQNLETAGARLRARCEMEEELLTKHLKISAERRKKKSEDDREKRERSETAIRRSRSEQMMRKEERLRREKEEERLHCDFSESKRRDEEEREKKKEKEKKELLLRIRKEQEVQIEENRKARERERLDELEEEKKVNDGLKNEDSQFRDFCKKEIERFRAMGKKTHMLEQVMTTKDVSAKGKKTFMLERPINTKDVSIHAGN